MKYKTFDRNMLKDLSKELGVSEPNPAPKMIYSASSDDLSTLEQIQQMIYSSGREGKMPTSEEMLKSFDRILYAYGDTFVEYRVTTTKFGRKVEVGYYSSPNNFVRHNNFGPAFMHERNIGKENYSIETRYYLNDVEESEKEVWFSSQTPENSHKLMDFRIGMMQ